MHPTVVERAAEREEKRTPSAMTFSDGLTPLSIHREFESELFKKPPSSGTEGTESERIGRREEGGAPLWLALPVKARYSKEYLPLYVKGSPLLSVVPLLDLLLGIKFSP